VNLDDRVGWEILKRSRAKKISYGTIDNADSPPDLLGRVSGIGPRGLDAEVSYEGKQWPVRLKLAGRHNFMNMMAAFGAGLALGWEPEQIAAGVGQLENVPGRLERIETTRGFQVYVDYAHTPDALDRSLATIREFTEGRVIAVFGCGGDRDKAKRPLMGKAVANAADVAVVTSDNPRTEDPARIVQDILVGMNGTNPTVEPDRAKAIRTALKVARPGDAVLVAGKGHEEYQLVGTERREFDDRAVVREALEEIG
jgi:UDP-N-acetylmuramoyl-L-alanyl-D-glutamate--2,6-diaminopimelate ligase